MATADRPKRRPKDGEPRPHTVSVKFSDQENTLLTAACTATGMAPGAYVALASLRAAKDDAGIGEFIITWPDSWPADLRMKHFDAEELPVVLAGLAIDLEAGLAPGESITITRTRKTRSAAEPTEEQR